MALPLPLVVALLAGGTAANYAATQKRDRAAGNSYKWLADRSKYREDEAVKTFGEALGSYQQDPNAEVDEGAAENEARIGELLARDAATAKPGIPGTGRSPVVVKEVAARLGDELMKQRAEMKALATIEAFGGRNLDKSIERQARVPTYQNLGLFGRGDRNVADAKLMAASQQGQELQLLGDVLTMVGAVGAAGAAGAATKAAKPVAGVATQTATKTANLPASFLGAF